MTLALTEPEGVGHTRYSNMDDVFVDIGPPMEDKQHAQGYANDLAHSGTIFANFNIYTSGLLILVVNDRRQALTIELWQATCISQFCVRGS